MRIADADVQFCDSMHPKFYRLLLAAHPASSSLTTMFMRNFHAQ